MVSGGNEPRGNALSQEDRLYINDGKGKFVKSINAFTQRYENKSCITVADVDKDGDIDIFIGNLANATAFGIAQTSYLMINDGRGKFTYAADKIIPLTSLGMVTAASFTDVNRDGWMDLVVTGEWMPLKIFINNKGVFKATEIPNSNGLWQTVFATDVNGDGFTDILAGNWGHNTKLYAGKDGPLKLYVKDFDNNGSTEQVMAYTIKGKEYTFLAKDELERPLPVLKKAYLTYSEVAGKTIDYMFYDLFKDYVELKAETLSSSCFMNDGKGNFIQLELPAELQLAPVMAFSTALPGIKGSYIGAGNFYGVIPFEGRYDALQPSFFSYNNKSKTLQYDLQLSAFTGESRDIKWLNSFAGNKILIISRNNKSLVFFKPVNL